MGRKQKQQSGQRPWRDVSTFAGGPGRKWTLWASVVLLACVVGVAVLVLLPRPTTEDPAARERAATASAEEPGGAGKGRPGETTGVCPQAPVVEDATAVPGDLSWVSVYGNSWPVSDTVGPKVDVDGLGHCFDRSPVGAALAAVGIMQSLRTADLETSHRILDSQFVQNPGKEVAAADMERVYRETPPHTRQWGRLVGYKVLFFTENMAQILSVEDWPQNGQYTGWTYTVVWEDGDWRLQLHDDGRAAVGGQITVDPDGFTRWEDPR